MVVSQILTQSLGDMGFLPFEHNAQTRQTDRGTAASIAIG